MDGWMDGCTEDERTHKLAGGRTGGWVGEWMAVCVDGRMVHGWTGGWVDVWTGWGMCGCERTGRENSAQQPWRLEVERMRE